MRKRVLNHSQIYFVAFSFRKIGVIYVCHMLTNREYRHIKVTVNIISILCMKSYSV